MKKINQTDRGVLGVLGLISGVVLFFAVNIIAVFAFKNYRADLTEAGLYSLSRGSKDAVARIKEPLTIRFYMSSKLAQVSETHASYAVRVPKPTAGFVWKSSIPNRFRKTKTKRWRWD